MIAFDAGATGIDGTGASFLCAAITYRRITEPMGAGDPPVWMKQAVE